jgi:hypothetical protein
MVFFLGFGIRLNCDWPKESVAVDSPGDGYHRNGSGFAVKLPLADAAGCDEGSWRRLAPSPSPLYLLLWFLDGGKDDEACQKVTSAFPKYVHTHTYHTSTRNFE